MKIISTPWKTFTNGAHAEGRVVAIGDVHGRADLLGAMLEHIASLSTLGEGGSQELVFTGDLIDRGPESLRCLSLAIEARFGGKPAIILPGNHEGMLVEALREVPPDTEAFNLWFLNGGHSVLDELQDGSGKFGVWEARQQIRRALPEGFLQRMEQGPTHHRSGDLLFVHAGIAPPAMWRRGLEDFLSRPLCEANQMHWAWIREPFLTWSQGWDADDRMIVVHGHTVEYRGPIEDEIDLAGAADIIELRRRVNLDCGAVFLGRLVALEAIDDRYRFHAVQLKR